MKNECPVAQITFVGGCPNKTCMWWTPSKAVPSKCIKIYKPGCNVVEYCKLRGIQKSLVPKAVRSIKQGLVVAEYAEWSKTVSQVAYVLRSAYAKDVARIAMGSRVLCNVGGCTSLNEVLNLLDKARYKRFVKLKAVQDVVPLEELFDLQLTDLNSLWRRVRKDNPIG